MTDMEKLWRLGSHNSCVTTVLSLWKCGRYASFEAALLNLVIVLVEQNDRQAEMILKMAREAAPTLNIKKETE